MNSLIKKDTARGSVSRLGAISKELKYPYIDNKKKKVKQRHSETPSIPFLSAVSVNSHRKMQLIKWVILAIAINVDALIGYDCGKNSPNITTFSLREVGKCENQIVDPEVNNINLQLLQKIEHTQVYIRSCRVKVHRFIRYCDWRKYLTTKNQAIFYDKISRETCLDMHRAARFEYEKKVVKELLQNSTNIRSLTLAGELQGDGDCYGVDFSTTDYTYGSVVVDANLEITLRDETVAADRDKEELILPSGTRCPLSELKCIDAENNYIFWSYQPKQTCDFDQFVTLFEGRGVRMGSSSINSPEVYFANSTKEIQFGLTKTGEFSLCGFTIYKTEHAKLFVTEYAHGQGPPVRKAIDVEDVILSAYFNTKFAHLEKHMKSQFLSLYKDIITHRCRLEREIIENSLLHIHNKPDIVALTIMKRPGFIAVKAGEVAHIISCEAVICKIRHVQECYQEIPVTCNNASYFLKPQSHIMTVAGTPTDCNPILPIMFKIENAWVQITPTISSAITPQVLEPLQNLTWKYEDMQNLIESGIYKPSDLKKLREHVMFPAERPAILEDVARKLTDRATASSANNYKNLLDIKSIEDIAESKLRKIWDGFTQFGIYAAGIMGIVTIIHLIKLVADTLIRGYTLKTTLGWGIHIIGAVWGSLTHLIVTMAQAQQQQQQPPAYELREIVTQRNPNEPTAPQQEPNRKK